MEPIISVHDLWFSYERTPVLKGLKLEIHRGDICFLMGPNGSGKSTFMHCLNGFLKPSSGTIRIDGRDLHTFSLQERARTFAFVSQDEINSFPYQVIDMVVMGRTPFLNVFDKPARTDYEKAWEILRLIGFDHLGNRPYTSLSGGEKQIVRLARAFTQSSDMLLLDEPTVHLDIKNSWLMLNILCDYALEHGKTIVASMHDPNLVLGFARKVVLIGNGEILAVGPVDQVMTSANLTQLYQIPLNTEKINGYIVITCPTPKVKYPRTTLSKPASATPDS
ncbi:ABC transporter ATP-binding protein [bacterium]|nr:ABC transporter ATP-binding protein [bacterium]